MALRLEIPSVPTVEAGPLNDWKSAEKIGWPISGGLAHKALHELQQHSELHLSVLPKNLVLLKTLLLARLWGSP